jgi:post-segregation antitoxin (ccd killing protein)
MARERNTAQIVARVADADRQWLDREAERQGLNVSSLVRTTIRRQRLASEAEKAAGERLAVA